MIRLGIRMTFGGGRDSLIRLSIIAAAVAVGVALLLTAIAGINAVGAQDQRYAWLETGYAPDSYAEAPVSVDGQDRAPDPIWWASSFDYFDHQEIGRIDVAATGAHSAVPPGVDRLPGPGEFYASPAMSDLLASTPANQLGDRYPGDQVGTIANDGLPDPDILLILIGHDPDELSPQPRATLVTNISSTAPSECRQCAGVIGINPDGIVLVLSVVVAALLFPVLIFIGAATRLSAARREARFAAMRLAGATPRQITVLAVVESSIAALGGTIAGFGLFFLLRPAIAGIPFTGAPFFLSDLALDPLDILVVVIGVPVAAAVSSRFALRRVQISPLGVSRHTTPPPPRAWRLIPLVLGVAELASLTIVGPPTTTDAQAVAYLAGIMMIMAGLVVAGPWLTMIGSRLVAGRTGHLAGLIAGRRLADNPRAGFRAISGLVLAVFIGSAAIGTITTVVASKGGVPDSGALVQQFFAPLDERPTSIPVETADALGAVPGVTGTAVIHAVPDDLGQSGRRPGAVSCVDLRAVGLLGTCADGATTAIVRPEFGGAVVDEATSQADVIWPASDITLDELADLPIETIVVANDGTTSAIEQARSILQRDLPQRFAPETVGEINRHGTRDLAQFQQLANVVIVASLVVAGCSLAVSVAGGLSERKRPFSLLRLSGVPLTVLRRVVALESAVPLLLAAVVAAAGGFLAAELFLQAQMDQHVQQPALEYYVVVLTGLAVSLAVIASTFPLLRRITGPETARND